MPFGSVFKMTPKQGKKQEILDLMRGETSGREVKGMTASYVFDSSDGLWGVAVFEDERSYRANADDPEQDKWYRQLRELLDADPEWHDGNIQVYTGT